MIGFIKGTVDTIRTNHLLIDTGNIGYKVLIPLTILSKIKIGDSLKVYTYTYVREDALELFGFETMDDLALFELFLTVPGVGPKTAIGIFTAGTTSHIKQAIVESDIAFFSSVPRLGKKNAQKIILELKSKLGDHEAILDFKAQDEEKEITSALKDFGFKTDEISNVLKKIRGQGVTLEERMKLALKQLAK